MERPRLLPVLLLILLACFSTLSAQEVRLTEFLAVNTTGIVDEDNTRQGWIELWNPSTTSKVVLNGWRLVSGANSWTFPNVEIMPDERMIVWASGKNRISPTAPLHTSFTIDPSGGTISLFNSSSAGISRILNYPAQTADISWGRDEYDVAVTPTVVGRYTTPTPGARNNYTGAGVCGQVLIDQPSKAFTGSLTVTLTKAVADASTVIRYTTDGTVPTAVSPQYSAPFTISGTQMVRARVFQTPPAGQTALLPGEIATRCYLLLDATTSSFSSAMPLVVLTNFGAVVPDDGDQPAYLWVWEPTAPDNRARFTNAPTLVSRIVIDKRGSSTLGNPKYNLNVEFRKSQDEDDQDMTLLGMPSGSDWIFSGPYEYDRSDIHNPFIYALSNSIGRYAPRTRQAEVFMDVTGGALNIPNSTSGDYFGIYNIMEKIRRSADRVNVHKLDTFDNDAVSKTGGYIWKVDRRDANDSGFTAGGQVMAYYYPKEVEVKSPQRDPQEQYLTNYINSFNTAMQSGTWNDPVTGYAAWLDVDEAIDHHLLNVWPMNVDGMRLSGYWHKERGGKLIPGPIWDFDRAMASTDSRTDNPSSWRSTVSDFGTDFFNKSTDLVLWYRLFLDIDFYQKYIDRWQELRRGAFSQATVNALLDAKNAEISAEAVNRDAIRWNKPKRAWTDYSGVNYPASQAAEIQRIKDWLQRRADFMDSQWVGPVSFSPAAGTVQPGAQVTMTGPAGATIYYTLDGSDPRPSGGAAPSGGSVLTYTPGNPITVNATTRIRARAYNAAWTALTGANNPPLVSKWGGSREARFSTNVAASATNLTISEVSYHPSNPTAAELAINPAWTDSDFEYIELKNLSAVPVDLGGVALTAGVTFSFTNANAFAIPAGGFAIIAANPQAFAARYGNIPNVVGPWLDSLSNSSEQITLKSSTGAIITDFTYDDGWYPSTDGPGRTLVIYNPKANSAAFSTAANWRASSAATGSPGASEPNLAPVPNAGADLVATIPNAALTGTVQDDTLPNDSVTVAWSKLLGPGNAAFGTSTALATSVSFDQPGVYTLRLTANDGALSGTDDVTVTVRDTPSAWLSRNPGIGTLDSDPDGDGLTNFAEWALLRDPHTADSAALLNAKTENNHLVITYQRQKNSPAAQYVIQASNDLSSWHDAAVGEVSEVVVSDDGITQTVKAIDSQAVSAGGARFLRLRVVPQ